MSFYVSWCNANAEQKHYHNKIGDTTYTVAVCLMLTCAPGARPSPRLQHPDSAPHRPVACEVLQPRHQTERTKWRLQCRYCVSWQHVSVINDWISSRTSQRRPPKTTATSHSNYSRARFDSERSHHRRLHGH